MTCIEDLVKCFVENTWREFCLLACTASCLQSLRHSNCVRLRLEHWDLITILNHLVVTD